MFNDFNDFISLKQRIKYLTYSKKIYTFLDITKKGILLWLK